MALAQVIKGHESIRIGVRQRLQQHAIDDAEDRAVCADAERQRDNCDHGKSGTLDKTAKRVTDVLPEGVHPTCSSEMHTGPRQW